MRQLYNDLAAAMQAWSADGSGPGDQRKVQWGDPARPQIVDRRDRVERPHPGRQATGRRRVPTRAVGEPERGFLEDARAAFDVHPVDVVVVARRPVGRGVVPDAVDVFELDPGLAVEHSVDGEPDCGDVPGLDDALRRGAFRRGDPLVPGGGDLVEHDAGGVGDHRDGGTPREDQDVAVFQHRAEFGLAADAHLYFVVTFIVGVVQQL